MKTSKSILIFDMNSAGTLSESLVKRLRAEQGQICHRHFPDGESYVRLDSGVKNREVLFIADLHNPDCKILPLLFAANTAKDLGAARVGLVAPYLPYMRQDKAFQKGEAISSHSFARLLSDSFGWLVTIDPHLHRVENLADLYTLNSIALSAMQPIVSWIENHVINPLIIGPDIESHQWASSLAQGLKAPFIVAHKTRSGDRSIEIDMPDITSFKDHVPIVIDDIISTGTTLIKTIKALKPFNLNPPICIAVHALMQVGIEEELRRAGASQVITTNTIVHSSNQITIDSLISDGVSAFLDA